MVQDGHIRVVVGAYRKQHIGIADLQEFSVGFGSYSMPFRFVFLHSCQCFRVIAVELPIPGERPLVLFNDAVIAGVFDVG
ncbi:MAG: hypothetical protein IPM82_11780 [Saprospiraceae bacterium]|nr:hypothetical protein [Saprospiraceae bacterium]